MTRTSRDLHKAEAGDLLADSVGNGWPILGNDGERITYALPDGREQSERLLLLEAMGFRVRRRNSHR